MPRPKKVSSVAGDEAILRAEQRRREHLAQPGVEGDEQEGEAGGLVRVVAPAAADQRPVERPAGVGVDVQRAALDDGVGQGQPAVRVVVRAAVDEVAVAPGGRRRTRARARRRSAATARVRPRLACRSPCGLRTEQPQ